MASLAAEAFTISDLGLGLLPAGEAHFSVPSRSLPMATLSAECCQDCVLHLLITKQLAVPLVLQHPAAQPPQDPAVGNPRERWGGCLDDNDLRGTSASSAPSGCMSLCGIVLRLATYLE